MKRWMMGWAVVLVLVACESKPLPEPAAKPDPGKASEAEAKAPPAAPESVPVQQQEAAPAGGAEASSAVSGTEQAALEGTGTGSSVEGSEGMGKGSPAPETAARQLQRKSETVTSPNAPTGMEGTVAWSGQQTISVEEFQQYMLRVPAFQRREVSSLEKKTEVLRNMIKFETLAQQAVEAGYADNVEVRLATKTEMVRQFLRDRFESEESFPVTDEEILARYEKDPGRFQRPERVRASHIMVSDRNQAEEVLSKLREKVAEPGTNARRVFREFVRAYSQDEVTKKRGGDLLYFGRDGATDGDGSVDPAVVAAAFSMYNTDQVSGVVRGSRGYHILLVTHRRDKVDRSLEAAAEELRQELRAEKQEEARRKFLEDVVNEDAWHIETSVLSSVTVDGVPDSSSLKARVKSIEETGETE